MLAGIDKMNQEQLQLIHNVATHSYYHQVEMMPQSIVWYSDGYIIALLLQFLQL